MLAPDSISARARCKFVILCAGILLGLFFVSGPSIAEEAGDPVPKRAEKPQHPYPNMSSVLSDKTPKKGRNADVAPEQLERWIKDLDANNYASRKRALAELRAVGKRAVPELEKRLLKTDSLEVRTRGLELLVAMAKSENIEDEAAAFNALRTLEKSNDRRLVSRSKEALRSIATVYNGRAFQRLQSKGAIIGYKSPFANAQGGRFPLVAQTNEGLPSNHILFNDEWRGTSDDLEMLKYVTGIRSVALKGENITDEFLAAVAYCESLTHLSVRRTQITDAGVLKLKGLPLRELDIRFAEVTDKSLETIASMKTATEVYLVGTRISPDQLEELSKALPGCDILLRSGGFLGVGAKVDAMRTPIAGLGCIINRPQPNSAAEKAGLLQDDVIVKIDDTKIGSFDELRERMSGNRPGDEIVFTIRRGKNEIQKKIVLGEWPEEVYAR